MLGERRCSYPWFAAGSEFFHPMPVKVIDHVVRSEDHGRVDRLVSILTGMPRSRARGLVDHGGVTLDGEVCTDPGNVAAPGSELVIRFDPARKYSEKPKPRKPKGFSLVHLDDHLVVVDKHSGVLTVPTGKGDANSLVDLLANYLTAGSAGRGRRKPVHVVHRLDRDTSGLLIFGRDEGIARALINQFAAHKPEREYRALVAGRVARDEGTVRSHLVTDKSLNQRSRRPGATGKPGELAITHFKVLTWYADVTEVAVRLETGQRNQIRAHFAEMGHPVLGDARYLPEQAAHAAWPYRRLALHARVLGFVHPAQKKPLRFESPLPDEFVQACGRLKRMK